MLQPKDKMDNGTERCDLAEDYHHQKHETPNVGVNHESTSSTTRISKWKLIFKGWMTPEIFWRDIQLWMWQWKQEWKGVCGNEEDSQNLSHASWCTTKMWSSQVSQSPICVVDDVGKTAAEMNYYAPLAELDQEKLKNCEVSLIDAGLDGGFDHTSKCIWWNTKR